MKDKRAKMMGGEVYPLCETFIDLTLIGWESFEWSRGKLCRPDGNKTLH